LLAKEGAQCGYIVLGLPPRLTQLIELTRELGQLLVVNTEHDFKHLLELEVLDPVALEQQVLGSDPIVIEIGKPKQVADAEWLGRRVGLCWRLP
jgi:hypothetical protein